MTPPRSTRVSQREPNSTRVLPAVVQHPDPGPWICSERNVHTDALCHELTSRQARRRELSFDCLSRRQPAGRSWPQAQKLMFALLCGLLFFCQSAQASLHGSSILERELVYDRRPAPKPRMGLHARQDDSSSSPAATTTATSGLSSIDAPSSTSSISESQIQTASSVPTSLPRPFDSSIGNNFTEPSCPQFFNDFLSNDTFQECLPFSLLLQVSHQSYYPDFQSQKLTTNPQTSNSFFTAIQSPLSRIRTLDATCHLPSYPSCSTLMSSLATQLASKSCAKDLSLENPLATQAYAGFLAYDTLYAASCLTSPETGNYCYADAVSNTSAPTSSYVYYLPLGMSLPAGTRPACTPCLRDTMAIFAAAAADRKGDFRGDYAQAAQVVDLTCGPGFVQPGVASNMGAKTGGNSMMGLVALAAILLNTIL